MKRCAIDRDELAIHEAGHLVAIAMLSDLEPGDFMWRRLANYEIAHVEPIASRAFDWETASDRNTLIVRRAVVALAGGAAVDALSRRAALDDDPSLGRIHEMVGSVDFELAHEWLTLQRYDPEQSSLESEITRLFLEMSHVLRTPAHRSAIATVSQRIFDHLRAADAAGVDVVRVPGGVLLESVVIVDVHEFALKETLVANPDR